MNKQDTGVCERLRKLVPAYVDGELNRREAAMLEQHLRCCSSCAREAEQLRACSARLTELLSEAAEDMVPPARLRTSVMQAVSDTPQDTTPKAFGVPLWRRLGTIAAAFLCVVSAVVIVAVLASSDVFDRDLMNRDPASNESMADMTPDVSDGEEAGPMGDANVPATNEPEQECYKLERIFGDDDSDSDASEMLDGVWQGDDFRLSFSTATGKIEATTDGETATRTGDFTWNEQMLIVIWEDGERSVYALEMKEGTMWLTWK